MSEVTTAEGNTLPALTPTPGFSLTPTNLAEAKELATLLANSDLVPKDYREKPGNVLVAVQMGSEVGLQPMQALQNIAVINGRPSLWGDAVLALIRNSGMCKFWTEGFDEDAKTGWAETRRIGDNQARRYEFSMEQAKTAGLLGKQGPWKQYPERMCMLRARGFLTRDVYPDVLRGLVTREEAMDIVDVDVVVVDPVETPDSTQPPSRTNSVKSGMRKTAQQTADEAQAQSESTQPASGDGGANKGEREPDDPAHVEGVLAAIKDAQTQDQLHSAMDELRDLGPDANRQAVPFVSAARKRISGDS